MIWITSERKHIPVSQMDSTHLENTINYLMNNHKPSCIINNHKAIVWVKAMSKELNNRQIAIIKNNIAELRKQNLELLAKYNKEVEELALFEAANNELNRF